MKWKKNEDYDLFPSGVVNFVYGKNSINVDKYCFPSLNGLDLEQNQTEWKPFPRFIKLLEYKESIPVS